MFNILAKNVLFTSADASATSQAAAQANTTSTIITFGLLIVVVVVFYFVVLRPNKKQQKKEEEMKASLKVRDEITTIGGIVGVVVAVNPEHDTFTIITSRDKTRLTFARSALRSIDNPYRDEKVEPVEEKVEETKEETK